MAVQIKFFPEKNTIKKIAPYALGTLAVGAVVGISYFGFTYQIPVSAFTDAQLATAIVGSGAKIASFTAAQFAIATGYGAVVVTGLTGSVFGAFKAAQFAVQQCAKPVKPTIKLSEHEPDELATHLVADALDAAPVILSRPDSPSKRLPSAELNDNNIIQGNRARTPSKIHNVA